MHLSIHHDSDAANAAAAARLSKWLTSPGIRHVMLAGGNSPIQLYGLIANLHLRLDHLQLFVLDEYVGVPDDEPRNCANLIRRTAALPWGVPSAQYFTVRSNAAEAAASVQAHEARIEAAGGLDVIVLGLGQNGHLGFNEPGSPEDSRARLVDLEPISIAANRQWFQGDYAPTRGATVGLRTILAARHVLVLAYGPHKSAAVEAMVRGLRSPNCPASLLQGHPSVHLVLDEAAAHRLKAS